MNILFCGCCLPRVFEKRVEMLSVAGNQYQNNLVDSLKTIGNVKTLSFVNIPTGNDRDEILAASDEDYQIILAESIVRAVKEYRTLLKKNVKWADLVIVYNSMYPWFGVGKIAGKRKKKSVIVLADYTPASEQSQLARKLYALAMKMDFSCYTRMVLLSSGSEKYVSKNQEHVIINGCVDEKKFENLQPIRKHATKNIVYTGVLSYVTGVDMLINAFLKTNDESYRLMICGQGRELDSLIKAATDVDSRIICKGFLSTEEYIKVIEDADVLVNPRNMKFIQNQNNFPSKVLEYLSSGRPIVSTKFKGFERYSEHIIFVESDENALLAGIERALELDSDVVYEEYRTFIKQFTWERQIKEFL